MFKIKGGKMSALILILISILLGVTGQLFLKKGMSNVGSIAIADLFSVKLLSVATEKFVIVGIFLYVIATGFWVVVLSQEELSFAYPLIGMGYIFAAILSKIFFNENLTLFRMIGILMIAAGAYLIVLKI